MRTRSSVLALTLLLALAGATQLFAPPLPPSRSPDGMSADEQLLAIGRDLPGFGGLFVDAQGRVSVYMIDPQRYGGIAAKALGSDALVLRADFRFDELLGWRYAMRPLLGIDGVTQLDVDESRNRVVVGVEPSAAAGLRTRLLASLAASGIPAAAVTIVARPAFVPLPGAVAAARPPSSTSVRGRFRPAPGGVQIVFSNFVCTLGFNAHRGRDFGFVVNDHCTNVRGESDGTLYSQGVPGEGTIGSEIGDPAFFVEGDCPARRHCRFSDSAFAKYSKKTYGRLAQLARPTGGDPALGSLVVSPATARFSIVGKAPDPLFGQIAHKVGRTTGWTYGEVVGTCVDANVEANDVTMLCQTFVAGGSGGGDSGSPVFSRVGATQAKLMGILWGGATHPDLGELFAFSPLSAIERELGTLRVN